MNSGPVSLEMEIYPEDGDQGFDEMFEPPPPDVYECPICLLVLNQPMQTVCGHRFCKGCILKVLREGRKNCPIDNEELDESQVYPDNFARREISGLNVRCRNYRIYNCKWIGSLKTLREHLDYCEFGMVPCPNGCGLNLSRKLLNDHVNDSCERRIVCCEYCDIKVVYKQFNDHQDRCLQFPVDCPNVCPVGKIPRKDLTEHLDKDCPNSLMKCLYRELGCHFEGTREEMGKHNETASAKHFGFMTNTLLSVKKMQDQHGQSFHRQYEMERLTNRILDLEEIVDRLKTSNLELEKKVESLTQSAKENDKMIQEVNARVWNGSIIWKIKKFKELFRLAKCGEKSAIHSFPFYTGVPGYKMCIRVNLNGIDAGANTHISMFVHLMEGEFDSVISWPFPGSIVLTIMDQDAHGEPQHVRETLNAKPSLQAFVRPKSSRNQKGYGYVEMISHATLMTRGYVKEDCLIVKVEVKTPRGGNFS